jgi:hypothetical protein
MVKTGAGNLTLCVRGVICRSAVSAGFGFSSFSCVPHVIMYNNLHMIQVYAQTLPDIPSYAISDLRNSEII